MMTRTAPTLILAWLTLAACVPPSESLLEPLSTARADDCESAYRARIDAIDTQRDREIATARRKADPGEAGTTRTRPVARADMARRDALDSYRRCRTTKSPSRP
jgi:hypothetical protein